MIDQVEAFVDAIHNPPEDIIRWLNEEYQSKQDELLMQSYEALYNKWLSRKKAFVWINK